MAILQQPRGSPLVGFDPPSETAGEFTQNSLFGIASGFIGRNLVVNVDPSLVNRRVYLYLYTTSTNSFLIAGKVEFLYSNTPKGGFPFGISESTSAFGISVPDVFNVWNNSSSFVADGALYYNPSNKLTNETAPLSLNPVTISTRIDSIRATFNTITNGGSIRLLLACRSSL